MALGFLNHHAGDAAIAWSGGSEPGVEVNPAAIAAMVERGIDIRDEVERRVLRLMAELDSPTAHTTPTAATGGNA